MPQTQKRKDIATMKIYTIVGGVNGAGKSSLTEHEVSADDFPE